MFTQPRSTAMRAATAAAAAAVATAGAAAPQMPSPASYVRAVASVARALRLAKPVGDLARMVPSKVPTSGLMSTRQWLTLVPTSAQLELTLPLSAQLKLTSFPMSPNLTRGCVLKVLKLSSNVSDVAPRSSS